MEDKKVRCYNQETNQVRYIKESMLVDARIQGYFPQDEPENLPIIEMNIKPENEIFEASEIDAPKKQGRPKKI